MAPILLAASRASASSSDDTMIAAGESAQLAAALGPRAELYVVERFAHVDAGAATLGDSLRVWNAAIGILEERDRR